MFDFFFGYGRQRRLKSTSIPCPLLFNRFALQVAEEAEVARLFQEKMEAEKKAEAAKQSKKKKGKK